MFISPPLTTTSTQVLVSGLAIGHFPQPPNGALGSGAAVAVDTAPRVRAPAATTASAALNRIVRMDK